MKAVLLICFLFAAPCLAVSDDTGEARGILSRREYRGYRVESPQPADVEYTGGSGPKGSRGEGPRGEGAQTPRRSAGGRVERAAPTPRGTSGGSSMGSLSPGIVKAIFWVLGVIVLVVTALFVLRWWLDRKPRKKPFSPKATPVEEGKEKEAPAEGSLARAFPALEEELARAIAAGDFALAAVLRFKLFWLMAGWGAVNDEHEPRTWRDALKMIRSEERRRELRRLLVLVESVRYGRHRPDADEFGAWRKQLEKIEGGSLLA